MKNKGFTLTELLAVIVIIALVSTIAMTSVMRIRTVMNEEALNTKRENIKNAATIYYEGIVTTTRNNLRTLYGECNKNTDYCVCNASNGICNYKLSITVDYLVELKAYTEDSLIEGCKVVNPVDNSCLDKEKIIVYVRNNRNVVTVLFEDEIEE